MDVYDSGAQKIGSLKSQTIAGMKWSSISHIGRQIAQIITTVILARLLTPADFGLMGMSMVVIGFLNLFKDLGTGSAIIQRKELSQELLNSVFWLNTGFGFLATLLLIAVAPLVAVFYGEPRIKVLLIVLSLNFIVSSLSIFQQAILQRELEFNKLAKLEIAAIVCSSTVGIVLAFKGFGVWSLVLQSLVLSFATTLFLWVSSSWRPGFFFNWNQIKTVSGYSLNLTGFGIFNYFTRNTDALLIGRFLGAEALGYYSLAYRIMLYPLGAVGQVVSRVMFPMYSKIQDDKERFRKIYLKVSGAIALTTFPLMFGLFALSGHFVPAVFGDKWKPVSTLLLLFAPIGLMQALSSTVGSIYQATGRTDWMFRWGLFTGLLTPVVFYLGLSWGILGVTAAYLIYSLLFLYPNFSIPFKLIGLPMKDLWGAVKLPIICSILMFCVIFILDRLFLTALKDSLALLLFVPVGVIVYLAASFKFNNSQITEVFGIAGRLNAQKNDSSFHHK